MESTTCVRVASVPASNTKPARYRVAIRDFPARFYSVHAHETPDAAALARIAELELDWRPFAKTLVGDEWVFTVEGKKPLPHFIVKTWETWNRRAGVTVYYCRVWRVTPAGLELVIGEYSDTFCGGNQVIWQAFEGRGLIPAAAFARNETNGSPRYGVHKWQEAGFAIISEV